ncbi:MAG: NRDE family protein [Bacteroidota bacterium]
MCLIAFALDAHPDYSLILAANRDEFYNRPTAYAGAWDGAPEVIGGRDLKGGGTWLGMTRSGRVAAVTNFRDPQQINEEAKTRGHLTKDYLTQVELPVEDYLAQVQREAALYNGFNLLLFEQGKGFHFSNYEGRINRLPAGVHGLSNALLNTPWPKLQRLKQSFTDAIRMEVSHDRLLALLEDSELAPDEQLPDTGIGNQWEKAISSICIKTEDYGTCCSTVLTIDRQGQAQFTERSFPVGTREDKIVRFTFDTSEVATQ